MKKTILGIIALYVGFFVLFGGMTLINKHRLETPSAAPVSEFRQSDTWKEIEEKFGHEYIDNFQCSLSGGDFLRKTTVDLSWDAPAAFGESTEYFVDYRVSHNTHEDYVRVDEGGIFIQDTTFSYDFSQLPTLDDGDGYEAMITVNAVRPDGQVSPMGKTAYAIHFKQFNSMTGLEMCE